MLKLNTVMVAAQSAPILPVKVSDSPLLCLESSECGGLVAVGAGDGATSVLSLDTSMVTATKQDRNNASDMFER